MSLRATLDATRAALPAGSAGCHAIAAVYDRAIAERFTALGASRLALVATGGWARRELAPYSDIDFVILHDHDEAGAKQLCDRLLYPLWDEKLAIGHAVREPAEAARLARDDLATATALLDARHIAGDRGLTSELVRATLAVVVPDGNPNQLIAALAAEQQRRHDRFGASLYLLEPNLKQGIGALRDLATALWAAGARWHPDSDDALIPALVGLGHLTVRQADMLTGAREFLLGLRADVQLAARRRLDQLTFELQEAIAPARYPDREPRAAIEALMHDYYIHARGVQQLTERLLEAARVTGAHTYADLDGSFRTIDGTLAVRDPAVFDRPAEMVRLFRVAVDRALPIDGATRELVAERSAATAGDPEAARLVHDALLDLRDAARPSAFELMHQVGILGAVMPGWAPCTARVQHDLYHVYTVDQHQLLALAMQKQLARGELAAEYPIATALWREVTQPGPLLLATLLHDVGKPLGKGHAEKGAVIAGDAARRLGMTAAAVALTELLVRQHLTMAHLSQRRDLADPEVISRFAEHIGTDEQLVQLYLVTLCDTAMTAPGNLSPWKENLLNDLMLRTHAHLGTIGTTPSDAQRRGEVIALAGEPELVAAIDPRLLAQLTLPQAAGHVRLARAARMHKPAIAVEVHFYPMKGHSEVAIVAPDAPGVLAAIAGALAASRIDVLGAIVGHVAGVQPLALDLFYVRDGKGEAIRDDDARWSRLADDLRALLGGGDAAQLIAKRRKSGLPRRVTPGVETEIRLSDDSAQATIVEVFTQDRAGVLHAITSAIAELGLDISLAKISTEGEKVADVFYVTRAGARLTEPADRAQLVERLRIAVADVGEP